MQITTEIGLRHKLERQKTVNNSRQHCGVGCSTYAIPLDKFIASQTKLSRRKKFGRRYTVSDRRFALSLYYASPKAYKLCAKLYCFAC